MSNLEEHEAEQEAITAACEAGACDHPDCDEDDNTCRTCGEAYDGCGDGWDGKCPSCADATYESKIVTRCAPRWAWDIIDETLAMDANSKAFDPELRRSITAAAFAMGEACEAADDAPISRRSVDDILEPDPERAFEVTLWEKVTYTAEVTAGDEEQAVDAAEELVAQGKVDAVSQGFYANLITQRKSEG